MWCLEHAVDRAAAALPGKPGHLRMLRLARPRAQDMMVSATVSLYICRRHYGSEQDSAGAGSLYRRLRDARNRRIAKWSNRKAAKSTR